MPCAMRCPGSKKSILFMGLLDRHHREDQHFFFRFVNAVKCSVGVADVDPIGVITALHMEALFVAAVAGIGILHKSREFVHDDPLAFGAEATKGFTDLPINQNSVRQRPAPRSPHPLRCDPCPQ